MRNVDLVGGTFRKHSRETRRAFRILIVGKFLIYKKQERENAAGIDSGKCLIYAFRLKKKNEIFDRGEGVGERRYMGGEYEKKKKRVRKRASESEREKERLKEI